MSFSDFLTPGEGFDIWDVLPGEGVIEAGIGIHNWLTGGNGGNGTAAQRRSTAAVWDELYRQGMGGDPYGAQYPVPAPPGGMTNVGIHLCRGRRSLRFGGQLPGLWHQTMCGNVVPNKVTAHIGPDGGLAFAVDAGQPKTWTKISYKSNRRKR